MLSTLDRYVLGKLLRTFLLALAAILLIFTLGTAFRLTRDELTYWQLFRSLPYALVWTLPYALPLSLLIGVTLTYGRLAADREVTALESCGVSPRSLAAPALWVAAILSLASLFLESTVLPWCFRRKVEIGAAVLEEVLELGEGEHWAKVFRKQGFDIYVREHRGHELLGIVIHRDLGEHPLTLVAERGRVDFDRPRGLVLFHLEDVSVTVFVQRHGEGVTDPPGLRTRYGDPVRARLASYVVEVPVEAGRIRWKPVGFSSARLRELLDEEAAERRLGAGVGGLTAALIAVDDDLLQGRAEFASRAAVGSAPLLFVLLSLPLTLLLRHPNRLVPLVLGTTAVSAFFFAPLMLGHSLSDRTGSSPWWPFLADGVAAPAALALSLLAWRRGC